MTIKEQEIRLSKSNGYIVTKSNEEDRYVVLTGGEEYDALGTYLSILNKDGIVEVEFETLKIIISDSKVQIIGNSWGE